MTPTAVRTGGRLKFGRPRRSPEPTRLKPTIRLVWLAKLEGSGRGQKMIEKQTQNEKTLTGTQIQKALNKTTKDDVGLTGSICFRKLVWPRV